MSQTQQQIICPECDSQEDAVVEHTVPFWTYYHKCDNCGHTILESEWQLVTPRKETPSNGSGFFLGDPRAPLGIKSK